MLPDFHLKNLMWVCVGAVILGALGNGVGARGQATVSAEAKVEALYNEGIAALQRRDLAGAQADFEKVVKLSPRSPEAHNSLGWVLLVQQKLDPAIAEFNAALDLRTDFFQAYTNLSSALLQKGDAKGAIGPARRAVRFAPTVSETYRTLARALDAVGDIDGAVKQMKKALELDPGRAELHDEMGTLYVRQVQEAAAKGVAADEATLRSAEEEYREALRLQPEYAPAHFHLGVMLLDRKAAEEASTQLTDAARLDTNNAQTR